MVLKFGAGRGFGHSNRRTQTSFTPLSLFAASEPGFWYDPSDLTTLFQDSAGTTPVTAAGQVVGLVLDKRLGLVRGPELITNGDFNGSISGWTGAGATVSLGSNNLRTVGGGVGAGFYGNSFPIVSGTSYLFSFTIKGDASYSTIRFGFRRTSALGSFISTTFSPSITTGFATVSFIIQSSDTVSDAVFFARFAGTEAIDIDNISVRELPGNHATQSTALSRPTYQVDGNGRGYLSFDGSDDFLVTPTITPGTDKAQLFAGVQKLSDAATGILLEMSINATSENGALGIQAPNTASANYYFASRGTTSSPVEATTYTAPTTNVLTGIADIAASTVRLNVNGVQAASSTSSQGTGNYLSYPAYIGRRAGSTLPFNGRIYSLIGRFGANLPDAQITRAEAWVNARTGAY